MSAPDLIKICGLSTPESIDAAIAGGATHIGLIFFEKSPRNVSVEKAARLSAHAGDRVIKVAVSVNAEDEFLAEIVKTVKPDVLQLHGSETPDRVSQVQKRFGLPVIKAVAIRDAQDLEKAQAYASVADGLLLDAKAPEGSQLPGGNGVAFDWDIMDQWPENVPYILSGGLHMDNVADALRKTGTNAIDVSSGVESEPGQKDINRIEKFLSQVNQV